MCECGALLPWHGMKVALVTGFDGPVIFSGTKAVHDGTD